MAQKAGFHFTAKTPDAVNATRLESLDLQIKTHTAAHGPRTCATFAQIEVGSEGHFTVRGHLYTGDALAHLVKHMKIAANIQNEADKAAEEG